MHMLQTYLTLIVKVLWRSDMERENCTICRAWQQEHLSNCPNSRPGGWIEFLTGKHAAHSGQKLPEDASPIMILGYRMDIRPFI